MSRIIFSKRSLFFLITLTSLILIQSATAQINRQEFPESWQGDWSGALEIFGPGGKVNEVPMRLVIQKKDKGRYSWIIIYGEDEDAGKRDYDLLLIDPEKGHYRIDEKNGIVLDAFLFNNKLFEFFELSGSFLVTSTEKTGETLRFEVISAKSAPFKISGGTKFNEEEIPLVNSYALNVRQIAILHKNQE